MLYFASLTVYIWLTRTRAVTAAADGKARKAFLIFIVLYFISLTFYFWKTQAAREARDSGVHAAGPLVFKRLSRQEVNARLEQAIRKTSGSAVVYKDVLGEGPGRWDSDPRYPSGEVNCIIWIQQVISEVYGWGFHDKTPIMDRLRYYGGQVGFGLRKHYVVHWLALEPEPLKRIDLSGCSKVVIEKVDLDFGHFLRYHNYPCPLYRMDQSSFEINYASPSGLVDCIRTLPDGYYIMFGVATEEYVHQYGRGSGPLGLVHGMILKLEGHARDAGRGDSGNAVIYHASTVAREIREEKFDLFIERMRNLYKGYTVYELDPDWDFTSPILADEAVQELQRCEQGIYSLSMSRSDF